MKILYSEIKYYSLLKTLIVKFRIVLDEKKDDFIISTWVDLVTSSPPTPDTEHHQMLVTWQTTALCRFNFRVGEGQNNSFIEQIYSLYARHCIDKYNLINSKHGALIYTFLFTIRFERCVVLMDKTRVFYFPTFQVDINFFDYLFKTWSYKICPWEVSSKFPHNLMQSYLSCFQWVCIGEIIGTVKLQVLVLGDWNWLVKKGTSYHSPSWEFPWSQDFTAANLPLPAHTCLWPRENDAFPN